MSLGIMSLLLITCLAIGSHAQAPNIIFIMVDDMGWNDISYRPSTEIQTPTLTKLALVDGVRLENYYTGPSCGPTRSQFLSGKYTIHLGLQASNLPGCTNMALNSTLDTVADKLKAEGYHTHLIGKWHAGFNTIDHYPTYRGFDTFRGFLLSHSSNHFTRKSRYDGTNYYDYHNDNGTNIVSPYTGDDLDASGDKLYSTTAFTDRAVELIGQHDNQESMFMYLSYQAPHTPVETEKVDPYDSLYSSIPISDRKNMASMVSSIDAGVEKVVQALKDNNMYENSYIIFTSDNGGSNQAGASTWPLRGAKGSYYEGGIRNIGFVHSPLLNVGNNTETTSLIHVTDWMPTFMHIARGHDVDGQALGIDGVDQFTTITSGTASRDKILHTIERRQTNGRNKYDTSIPSAMVKEYNGKKYKILTGRMTGSVKYPNPSADYDEWEYVRTTKNQTAESGVRLYNLSDDPAEDYDLSSSSSSDIVTILSDLTAELRAYEQGAVDPIIPVYYGSGTANEECDPAKNGGAFSYYQ